MKGENINLIVYLDQSQKSWHRRRATAALEDLVPTVVDQAIKVVTAIGARAVVARVREVAGAVVALSNCPPAPGC